MNDLLNLEVTNFKNSSLIKSEGRSLCKTLLEKGLDPVIPLIARGFVHEHDFFSKLAIQCHLAFKSNLPVSLSPLASLSLKIPHSLSVKHSLYLYEEHGQAWCASPTPFVSRSILQELLSYTPYSSATVVISTPYQIRNALTQTYHHELSITATDRMEVLHPESSSKLFRNFFFPYVFPFGFFIIMIVWGLLDSYSLFFLLFLSLNLIYFFLNPYKIYVFFRSFNPTKLVTIPEADIQKMSDDDVPVYTVLFPLKNEVEMVPQIVKSARNLDYPPEKLDIKFVCEVTDTATITALEKEGVGTANNDASIQGVIMEIVKVPVEKLSTKPRSCNYAAQFARGSYLVIFDAEDRPDKDQLKKALIAFKKSPLDTVCAQARLNFYNSRYNTLTKLFSLEYSFWYDFFLPGNQEIDTAITLGGTSNHFVTSYLKKIGFWDPYNVTEDADLGLRIYRYRQHTTVFNSYTYEEANSQIGNWLHQRTRWQKGFLMTLLVNLRHPIQTTKEIGLWRYIQSLFAVASNFFLPFFNPILWIMFAFSFLPFETWLTFHPPTLLIRYIGLFNLIVGNATYIIIHAIVVIKKRQLYLLPYIFLLPAYWMLLSIACIRAALQFIHNPFSWEKTRHGLS